MRGAPRPHASGLRAELRLLSLAGLLDGRTSLWLLAAGLDTLDNQFADKGTSVPIILDQADKEALLPVLPVD